MSIEVSGVPGKCPCGHVVVMDPEVVRIYVDVQGEYVTRCPECYGLLSVSAEALDAFDASVAVRMPS